MELVRTVTSKLEAISSLVVTIIHVQLVPSPLVSRLLNAAHPLEHLKALPLMVLSLLAQQLPGVETVWANMITGSLLDVMKPSSSLVRETDMEGEEQACVDDVG